MRIKNQYLPTFVFAMVLDCALAEFHRYKYCALAYFATYLKEDEYHVKYTKSFLSAFHLATFEQEVSHFSMMALLELEALQNESSY